MKAVEVVDINACSGCRTCELACSFWHHKEYSPSLTRIFIEKQERAGIDEPVICRQCDDPACEEACPNEAFYRSENGILNIDAEKCTGCGACVEACPFKAVRISPSVQKAMMCDLCNGAPQCVGWCPTGALRYTGNTVAALRDLK